MLTKQTLPSAHKWRNSREYKEEDVQLPETQALAASDAHSHTRVVLHILQKITAPFNSTAVHYC